MTVFNEWFDIRLYSQMCSLIYRVSKKEEKNMLWEKIEAYALFPGNCEERIEDVYGLKYPGEVLERLEEKTEVTMRQIRALGLALGITTSLWEENMFVGTQLVSFLSKLKGKGVPEQKDPYILGIRYLVEEKRKKELYKSFISYPFERIEEILFAISILPEDDRLWEKVKKQLNICLGEQRRISVYENSEVYVWLAGHMQKRLKGYRKKDLDVLKYLIRLPYTNANGANGLQCRLQENGYSIDEIRFLNMSLIWNPEVPFGIERDSITAEKIAVDVCIEFLNSKEVYPEAAYELCEKLCSYYYSFPIKINGWENIFEGLNSFVEVKNLRVFCLLYKFKDKHHVSQEWRYIDLVDSTWGSLYKWLGEADFEECVCITLNNKDYSKQEIEIYLSHYQEITGKNYITHFWQEKEYKMRGIFEKLVEMEIIVPIMLIQEFLKDYRGEKEVAEQKWKSMSYYLEHYMMQIRDENAFKMIQMLTDEFGVSDTCELFPLMKIISKSLSADEYDIRTGKVELFRPFLNVDEHKQLMSWTEECVFYRSPEMYARFLLQILTEEDNLIWFPKTEAREIAFALLESSELYEHERNKLRQIYMTPEEYAAYQNKLSFLKQRKEMKEQILECRKIKKNFTKLVARTKEKKEHIKQLQFYITQTSFRNRKEVCKMVAAYLKSTCLKKNIHLFSNQDVCDALVLLKEVCLTGETEFKVIKEIIAHLELEVTEDEKEDIAASGNL